MKTRKLHEPIFNVTVHLMWQCTYEQANKRLYSKFNTITDLESLDAGALVQIVNGKSFVIWLTRLDTRTVSHEVSHLIDDIYSYRCIEHTDKCKGCSEYKAYYLSYWISKILKEIRK